MARPRPSARAPRPTAAASEADPTALAPVLEPEGRALLDSLGEHRDADALAVSSRLRAAGHPPERVAAVLTQAGLRARAVPRLGPDARGMLFTRDGLEQDRKSVV